MLIQMEPKKIAEKFLEMYKENKPEEILPLIIKVFEEDEILKKLVDVQIQIKELGGGWPPVGHQITTMQEIFSYSRLAIDFALKKDAKLIVGMLNHNVASFCFPNMDEGTDDSLIEPGYQAAIVDLEIRKEIGDKVPMMWSMWLVGVSEFVRGEVENSIKTLEKLHKIAMEEPQDENLAVWADMMKIKFQIKSGKVTKENSIDELSRIETILTNQGDNYGLSTLQIIKNL